MNITRVSQSAREVDQKISLEQSPADWAVLADRKKQRIGYSLPTGEAGNGKSTRVLKLANIWVRSGGFREVVIVHVLLCL